ncbi:hypothetical protein [Haliscomenobacter hydrossis]|uniref:Uncharacterized protein n=1 Tax=Haliscomenobacter hydrossis (strain ATCC 27775 / DSM 1100 / LMG 10767 / O) TaxID=760192 RepID=F4L4H3_HALH1|nr:hypothetical protein [Haliscomenobacter hydrossis]AEE51974.1 hypothetical protein Halhy_4128 [Haliscomenobacter hydrossis DSM 1100]
MKQILDEIEPEKPIPGKVFSILSFAFSILASFFFILLLIQSWLFFSRREYYRHSPEILVWSVEIACLLGVTFATVSLIRKEKLRHFKAIGVFLNFLIFGLILGFFLYAVILDMNR